MAEWLEVAAGITAALRSATFVLNYLVDVKETSLYRQKIIVNEISTTRGLLTSLSKIKTMRECPTLLV